MSKFVYIFHRRPLADGGDQVSFDKVERLKGFPKEQWKTYRGLSKEVFVWQQAPNVQVDSELNLRISFANVSGSKADLLNIIDKGNFIEVKGDLLGTRAIWYCLNEEQLIFSSSQKAIITLLGNYEPNNEAWTWMLSNGSLGPGLSWDKRIKALDAGSLLSFDKRKWNIHIDNDLWQFDYREESSQVLAKQLDSLLSEVTLDFDLKKVPTLLTLSGGYDSRAALFLLKKMNGEIHTATWGVPAAFKASGTDASVARHVSNIWSTIHTEYDVELKSDLDSALDSFLTYGEGRNDHINSFMDGLDMWRTISGKGYKWVIRADEAFGWLPVHTELDARTSVAMARLSDFSNVPPGLIASLPEQVVQDSLLRRDQEPIEDYRDRLYQQYRLPFVIGPLQDLPLSFVEILNPLLHPRLISFVRSLPPHLRTGKRLYSEWVNKLLPDIPYASVPAIPEAFHVAEAAENKNLFADFFHDQSAKRLLGQELMNFLQLHWKAKQNGVSKINSPWKRQLKTMLPIGIKKFMRNKITGYHLNMSSLALRAYIIYKMQENLKETAGDY